MRVSLYLVVVFLLIGCAAPSLPTKKLVAQQRAFVFVGRDGIARPIIHGSDPLAGQQVLTDTHNYIEPRNLMAEEIVRELVQALR